MKGLLFGFINKEGNKYNLEFPEMVEIKSDCPPDKIIDLSKI
jgi:hypothetical protein